MVFSVPKRLGHFQIFIRCFGVFISYIIEALVDYEFIKSFFQITPIVLAIIFFIISKILQYYSPTEDLQVRFT